MVLVVLREGESVQDALDSAAFPGHPVRIELPRGNANSFMGGKAIKIGTLPASHVTLAGKRDATSKEPVTVLRVANTSTEPGGIPAALT